jgi:hypothetical protein
MTSVDWLPMAPGTTTGFVVDVEEELGAFAEYGVASLEYGVASPVYRVTSAFSIVLPSRVPSARTRSPVNIDGSGGVLR